jgi:hypothetical protein
MIYYGYESEAAMRVISGEHLDALMAIYGSQAVCLQNARIISEIERLLRMNRSEARTEVRDWS